MIALALIIVARLVDIQVVRAAHYQALADQMLTRAPDYLPAPRGSILDRHGRVLVSDEPASDISVRYEVLATLLSDELPNATHRYLRAIARTLRERGRYPAEMSTDAIVDQLRAQLEGLWQQLSELTGVSPPEFADRAQRIRRRVARIKTAVRNRSPTVEAVAEERAYHPLVAGVDEDLALTVRIRLEPEHPWLRVVPSSRRLAHDADALVHVLGRLGAASPLRIESDPWRDDELRGLRAGDRCGISGVERAAELTLRGRRGRITEDVDHTVLERINPVRGDDVYLTIDADLQRQVLALLRAGVDESENPCGGAAVVIDVATREVLALVSYPVYGYEQFSEEYERLRGDTRWMPLRFRAVANLYPPGSTCKVIALYGGLVDGVVGAHEQIECTGHFRPDEPDKFRCWIYNRYRTTHGLQAAEDAVRNSCNIYFYTVGDRLGVDRLCKWFTSFGLGRTQGTGLIEETAGIVPTPEWIGQHRRNDPRIYPADAWNFAIGQGEVSATPLQAANVAATVAAGRWEPVRLLRDAEGRYLGEGADARSELEQRHLRVLRAGMWRVVNEPGGTGQMARLGSDRYALCGKTGSAQAVPRVLNRAYIFEWPGGKRETVVAKSKEYALASFEESPPKIVGWRAHDRFPAWTPNDPLPAHAWFIGYTQAADTPRGAPPRGKSYAISVLVEYGESGGKVAGPIARQIAELLVKTAN
jgi:penicillin-binding protein 2